MMASNMNFDRFHKKTEFPGFFYQDTFKKEDLEYDFNSVTMEKLGFTIFTNIQNYTAEAVLLGGNLRVSPTKIQSLVQNNIRPSADTSNSVVITILSSELTHAQDPKRRTTHTRKVVIKIPAKMLNQGSVFISELDCYIMTESQIDATRELIARDVSHQSWDSINLPASMDKQEPAIRFFEYKHLVKACIARQDKLRIRIGVDILHDEVPNIIKTMRVSILDSYFVPYDNYKLVYDPTLKPDEFIIDNLYMATHDEFKRSFSELQSAGTIYLDYDEVETIFGTYYGMGLFADEQRYLDYVHQRKTQERFKEESLHIARRSGDPRLKEEVTQLIHDNGVLKSSVSELQDANGVLEEYAKKMKAILRTREDTITRLRQSHEVKMSADVVMGEIENDRLKSINESRRIDNERIEMEHQENAAPYARKAAWFKTFADISKSWWGIATVTIGGIFSLIALCKKYNIKVSMSS